MKNQALELMIILILILASYIVGRYTNQCNQIANIVTKRDTVIVEKPSEPIVIEKAVPKLIYKRDTIIETRPFTAIIDTIIKRDTIYAKYDFPENQFDFWIRKRPDSIVFHTIYITKEITRERPWWEAPAYTGAGALVGFILGVITK